MASAEDHPPGPDGEPERGPDKRCEPGPAAGQEPDPHLSWHRGVRAGLPFAAASAVLSVSFAVLARDAGFSAVAAIVMSVVVFAGSAQFAAVAIIAAGGGVGAAVLAATLVNSRFLPMGVALGPSLPGRALWRGAQGQAVVDASWAMASRPDGSFDRWFLFGATAVQYVGWVGGTVLGVLGGSLLSDTQALGLDAVYPTFFLVLLVHEVREGRGVGIAAAGAAIALALIPFTPAGVPVLAASLAALVGLRARSAER